MTLASFLLVLATGRHRAPPPPSPCSWISTPSGAGLAARCARPWRSCERNGYPIKSIDIDQAPDLKEKYDVDAVPTFIVVDAAGKELGRTSGSQPAAQLARFYQQARAKAQPPANSRAHADADEEDDADGDDADRDTSHEGRGGRRRQGAARAATTATDEPAFENPKPWETVVRIRVLAQGSVGFGSGTVIHSSSNEALILTCAHIFKLDGQRQAPPTGSRGRSWSTSSTASCTASGRPRSISWRAFAGQALDYDFGSTWG